MTGHSRSDIRRYEAAISVCHVAETLSVIVVCIALRMLLRLLTIWAAAGCMHVVIGHLLLGFQARRNSHTEMNTISSRQQKIMQKRRLLLLMGALEVWYSRSPVSLHFARSITFTSKETGNQVEKDAFVDQTSRIYSQAFTPPTQRFRDHIQAFKFCEKGIAHNHAVSTGHALSSRLIYGHSTEVQRQYFDPWSSATIPFDVAHPSTGPTSPLCRRDRSQGGTADPRHTHQQDTARCRPCIHVRWQCQRSSTSQVARSQT